LARTPDDAQYVSQSIARAPLRLVQINKLVSR
jgi:hypothetical protein